MLVFKYALLFVLLLFANLDISEAQIALRRSNFMTLNPSAVGEEGNSRFVVFNRSRNLFLEEEDFVNYSITYDQYVRFLKGGIGVAVRVHERDNVNNTYASIAYAPKVTIRNRITLSPGITIQYESSRQTVEHMSGEKLNLTNEYLNYNLSLLVNSRRMNVGLSLFRLYRDHFNRIGNARYGFYSSTSRATIQLGYTFFPRLLKGLSFTPEILFNSDTYRWYDSEQALTTNAMTLRGTFKWKNLMTGIGVGDLSAIILMVGATIKERFTIQYAMDQTETGYGNGLIKSHEIALKFKFNERNNNGQFVQRNFNTF